MTGRWVRRVLAIAALSAGLTLLAVPSARAHPLEPVAAHPLGNFTVNHYDGLTVHPDRVDLHAVVDSAEIPTRQELQFLDIDGDGMVSPGEGQTYARQQCDQLSRAVVADVDGTPLRFAVRTATVSYPPGEAELPTTRLVCQLSAPAELAAPATLSFRDTFRAGRIGWCEITAVGVGVGLPGSPVPGHSVSDELRSYPGDLLTDPLDVREVALRVDPDASSSTSATIARPDVSGLDRLVGSATERFTDLVGTSRLTPLIGLLAVLLALVLGASHAMLPGHGKTVMAAYLAGGRGTARDALLVGATVTVTHTAGVLVLGLALSVFTALAGEVVLAWLGLLSGLLVAAVGTVLLRGALGDRRPVPAALPEEVPKLVSAAVAAGPLHGHELLHNHDHGHRHDHAHGHGFLPGHGHGFLHGHGHGHVPGKGRPGRLGRASLVGMGVAGGLVPSPSALVVLLAAIALGRTWFGVLLVLAYGLGMAATLTAAGLLLVHLRDRLTRRPLPPSWQSRGQRLGALMPVLTALLVVTVGVGLAVRGLTVMAA